MSIKFKNATNMSLPHFTDGKEGDIPLYIVHTSFPSFRPPPTQTQRALSVNREFLRQLVA